MYSDKINCPDLSISKKRWNSIVETKEQKFTRSITIEITNFEHALIFENTTALGVIVYDDVKNKRQHRLLVRGQRTQDWNGEKKAPWLLGIPTILLKTLIVQYKLLMIFTEQTLTSLMLLLNPKDLTIGNIDKSWTAV